MMGKTGRKVWEENSSNPAYIDKDNLRELEESLDKAEAFAYLQPRPMWSRIWDNNEEAKKVVDMTLSSMYRNFSNKEKSERILNSILSEIILGAYQDRMVAYAISPSGVNTDNNEAMEMIQRLRQKADLHLIRIIQAFKDIKRPPVNIVVKQADQVNVGEKQLNVDNQVNIPSDLDKK